MVAFLKSFSALDSLKPIINEAEEIDKWEEEKKRLLKKNMTAYIATQKYMKTKIQRDE